MIRKNKREKALEALDKVGLKDHAHKRPNLSGSYKIGELSCPTKYFKEAFIWKNIMTAPFKERCIFICIKLRLYKLVYIYNNRKLNIANLNNEAIL